jgi:uncharacterized protein (TIGR03437 family)
MCSSRNARSSPSPAWRRLSAWVLFLLTATPLLSQSPPPVILLNGWQFSLSGACPVSSGPSDTFGALPALLAGSGRTVHFFDNCVQGASQSLESLGQRLGQFIAGLGAPEVDLVAHSMGGLIARAYLAGLQPDGSAAPPAPHRIRKLVLIAVPNFGSYLADVFQAQLAAQPRQMIPASPFLWNLATWNQRHDDLRGVDAIAIAGNGGFAHSSGTPAAGASDGVVSTTSAALAFRPGATRLLPLCHIDSSGLILAFVNCQGPGIARASETHAIVQSFLAGTDAWRSIGSAPQDDPLLRDTGGLFFAAATAEGQPLTDIASASFGGTALRAGALPGAFYLEFATGAHPILYTSASAGTRQCGPFGLAAGAYSAILCKPGPLLTAVTPQLLPGTASRTVKSGGEIQIHGLALGGPCAACTVTVDPGAMQLQIVSWTDAAITALLPAVSGMVRLTVRTPAGSDTFAFLADPGIAPSRPVITSVVNGASFLPGIQGNSWITIRGVNLAPTARIWNPATEIVGGVLPASLDGVRVNVGGQAAVVYYISATQINALTPATAALGPVPVTVSNASGTSDPFQATLQAYAPGLFTFDPRGARYPAATHADGSLLGPADLYGSAAALSPARAGETIVLYGTAFGPTDPPVPSDRVFSGAAVLTGEVTVAIGGRAAQILFKGVTSNGLVQLNVVVPELPAGDHAIAVSAGGFRSEQAVFLAVGP